MVAGKVRFTDSSETESNLTYNTVYDIVGAGNGGWVILDDNGKPFLTQGASWSVEELYVMKKVV